MAFTRRFLKEVLAGREDAAELIDQIIEMHIETVAPLKAELNRLQEENGGKTADELHAEYERLTAKLEQLKAGEVDENGTPWKNRYEEEKARYDAFKEKAEAQAAYEEKAKAFRSMLIQEGVKYSIVDIIVRGSSDIINSMELQDGRVRNHESVSAAIRSECRDFIGKGNPTQTRTVAPTRESIMNITDRSERLAAIQQNPHLFRN